LGARGIRCARGDDPAWPAPNAQGPYAYGAEVTLADICLVPQVANARRLKVPLDPYPKIVAVDAACAKLAAFEQSAAREPAGCGMTRRTDERAPRPAQPC